MNFLNGLFCCEEPVILEPLCLQKTISENLSAEEFPGEIWIRKTPDIHCKFDYKLSELVG